MISKKYIYNLLKTKGYTSEWTGQASSKESRLSISDDEVNDAILGNMCSYISEASEKWNLSPLTDVQLLNMFKFFAIKHTRPDLLNLSRDVDVDHRYPEFWQLAE